MLAADDKATLENWFHGYLKKVIIPGMIRKPRKEELEANVLGTWERILERFRALVTA